MDASCAHTDGRRSSVLTAMRVSPCSVSSARSPSTWCAPVLCELLLLTAPIDTDHHGEPAARAGLDACDRILDHRRPAGCHAKTGGRLVQDRRIRLARQFELGHGAAVDLGIEQLEDAGIAQNRLRVTAGREHRDLDPGFLERRDEGERAREGLDPVVLQPGVEMAVLAVAETADGIFIGFVRPAIRQFDAP
jgi:hypothetical protein